MIKGDNGVTEMTAKNGNGIQSAFVFNRKE